MRIHGVKRMGFEARRDVVEEGRVNRFQKVLTAKIVHLET
jgi:hypothetical protein